MKLYIALFAIGMASVTASIVHHAQVHGENKAARFAQQIPDTLTFEEQSENAPPPPAAHVAPKHGGSTFANVPPSNRGALKRVRLKPALGNPAAARSQAAAAAAAASSLAIQTPVTGAHNINKEIKEALLNPEEGRAADNNFSSLLLAAIASSHGDLPIISI
ncbi:hypothetical protein GGI24_003635 [Coemansia furcata]|nr:hypothetical protein GGI24_003635 [Coemansia furcata]